MTQLFANNASSSLAAGVTSVATSLTLATGQGALFPAISGADFFLLTLTQPTGPESSWEIVKVTARTTDTLTIVRAQEGTLAAVWATGTKAELRVTAAVLNPAVSGGANGLLLGSDKAKLDATSNTNTGDETLATIKTKLGVSTLSGSNTGDQVLPTTLPASDVYAWAKTATKPSYTATEVGLGNVPNLAFSGTNTGDETLTTIKTKLGVTTLSGSNTGDQTIPTTLPNANAVTFKTTGGAAAGSTYTGAAVLAVDYSTVGAAASGHTHSYQAADADLLAIGGLTGTSGYLKKTAADTWTLDTSTFATGSGTASGTNTGDQTTITGNAGSATTLSAGADRTKLDGIAASANNYAHPASHPPSIITQDASNRFVTDTEKTTWNAKQPAGTYATGGGTATGNNTGDQDLSGKQNVLVSGTNIKTVNGQSLLGGGDLALANTSLSGNTTIYVGQVIAYTITDFDSFSTYAVAVSAGSVTRTLDAISFTAPAVAGNVTLTVTTNGVARAITLIVLAASVVAPTITSPANAATGVLGPAITLTSNAFGWLGVSDTHLNSDWQLATDAAFTSIVQSVSASATYKTNWSTTVTVGTTYYARVRHRGSANGVSSYSTTVTFSTAATFNAYIATPTATPAAFGDSFEGGFYTGQIWNELVQSASSYAIGTGSKAFVVADMTATPLVYAGQTLEVRSRANPANKMIGVVTGALGTALTINVTSVGGSGTFTDWSIMAKYRVIVAPKATGENTAIAFKNANDAAPAACGTLSEGRKATLAMVAAGTNTVYPAAHWCNNLSIAGKTDWYLPARDELELCWRNLKPTADANYVTTNRGDSTIDYKNLGSLDDAVITHGSNNNTSPIGAAYIAGTPAQVAAGKNFRTSESEAFAYGSFVYWSASEYSATNAWGQYWHSSHPGYQNGTNKANAYYVRAVRRSII